MMPAMPSATKAGAGVASRLREERDGEADQAVGAKLQEDARQDHRAGRRRLRVGIGQPGVEREHRHFHGEG